MIASLECSCDCMPWRPGEATWWGYLNLEGLGKERVFLGLALGTLQLHVISFLVYYVLIPLANLLLWDH